MASNLWLYGNSAADLGPQERAWAGFYQGAAENNRAAADRASQINANLILQQQQADEAAMARDQSRNIDLWRYGVDAGHQQRNEAENLRRFNLNLGLTQEAATEDKRRFGIESALKLRAIEAKPDTGAIRTQQYEDQRLQQMADAGEINDEGHVKSLAPSVPDPLAKLYASRSRGVRAEIDAQDAELKNAANFLNSYQMLLKEEKGIPTKNPEVLAERAERIASLAPQYQALTGPKSTIAQRLEFDESTGRWTPILPARAWRNQMAEPAAERPAFRGVGAGGSWEAPLSRFATEAATSPPRSRGAGGTWTPSPNLSQYEGKRIRQNGVMYRITNGVAVEE